MKVSCGNHEFSEKWDKKLNKLLIEGTVDKLSTHTITLKIETRKTIVNSWVFWIREEITYDCYEVWVSNKSCAYGALVDFNGVDVPDYLQYSASQETLNKLFELESDLRNPTIKQAYN